MNTALIKPQWSPLTVVLMILGFVFFWPLGLVVLAYILWGEKFGGSADRAQAWMNKQKAWANGPCGPRAWHRQGNGFGFGNVSSGNAAFDDYRAEQLRRLEEERKRLDEEVDAFHEYLRNLHMARDREEFDRFMRDRRSSQGDQPNPPSNNGF